MKEGRKTRLSPRTAAPNLADHCTMRDGDASGLKLALEERHHTSVAAFDRDEGARIED
jgi:hypothetical protein